VCLRIATPGQSEVSRPCIGRRFGALRTGVHLRRFAETAVGHGLSDGQIIEIVTKVAEALGVKAYVLDWRICEALQRANCGSDRGISPLGRLRADGTTCRYPAVSGTDVANGRSSSPARWVRAHR